MSTIVSEYRSLTQGAGMNPGLHNVTIDQIMQVYLAAMKAGWANGGIAVDSYPELPNSHIFTFPHDDFLVEDRYEIHPGSSYIHGTTIISRLDFPIWVMQYMGYYCEEVLPFLKRALLENYSKGIFLGGRGPAIYSEKECDLVYINHTKTANPFENFSSYEFIHRNGTILGEHWHRGLLFLK